MSDRPAYCCGVCPAVDPTTAHPDCEACRTGYDCTCRDNPRCPNYQEISMTDQTPTVTAGAIRRAHEWCDLHWPADENRTPMADVIRHYRATVPAPPAALADELREHAKWERNIGATGHSADLSALADRVEAVEKENRAALNHAYDERDEALVERDDARAEVERLTASLNRQCTTVTPSVHNTDGLTASNDTLPDPAEVGSLTSGRTVRESRTVALPDPADVPSEEMWLIRTKKDQLMAGVRNPNGDWSVLAHNGFARECELDDEDVTLVARLVPDVRRVIDRPEDLDKLPVGSIVIDMQGDAWQVDEGAQWNPAMYSQQTDKEDSQSMVAGHLTVTVIHEPEVTA